MKRTLWIILLCIIPAAALADADKKSVAEVWQCELKDGKTMKEVQANNTRWLTYARERAGSEDVNSYALQAVVGDLEKFLFIDTYPTMGAWAAAKSAEQSEEGKVIEAAFDELMECSKNRLYNATQH